MRQKIPCRLLQGVLDPFPAKETMSSPAHKTFRIVKRISPVEIAEIVVPALLAVSLFIAAAFAAFLPAFRNALLEQKRAAIVALTDSAMATLQYHERMAAAGQITQEAAKAAAANHLRTLRYGPQEKDYFWISDTSLRLVMHPYRRDLEGRDLSDYRDQKGKRLFAEFADAVKESGAGFVSYHWQWKDDPVRIGQKLSYVRLYRPWGWILGTGVYVDDVDREIDLLSRRLVLLSLVVLVLIALLSAYIIHRQIREMTRRQAAEQEVDNYRQHLEELVQERTVALRQAMGQVKQLSGFLPICASCKKIRDDTGYWNQIESFIRDHSEAEFSHSICPDCAKNLYPDLKGR